MIIMIVHHNKRSATPLVLFIGAARIKAERRTSIGWVAFKTVRHYLKSKWPVTLQNFHTLSVDAGSDC